MKVPRRDALSSRNSDEALPKKPPAAARNNSKAKRGDFSSSDDELMSKPATLQVLNNLRGSSSSSEDDDDRKTSPTARNMKEPRRDEFSSSSSNNDEASPKPPAATRNNKAERGDFSSSDDELISKPTTLQGLKNAPCSYFSSDDDDDRKPKAFVEKKRKKPPPPKDAPLATHRPVAQVKAVIPARGSKPKRKYVLSKENGTNRKTEKIAIENCLRERFDVDVEVSRVNETDLYIQAVRLRSNGRIEVIKPVQTFKFGGESRFFAKRFQGKCYPGLVQIIPWRNDDGPYFSMYKTESDIQHSCHAEHVSSQHTASRRRE